MKTIKCLLLTCMLLLLSITVFFANNIESLNPDAFITTWRTTSANESITIPTFPGETYDYTVDWGDGNIINGYTEDASHTYLVAGEYQVKITGIFQRISFLNSSLNNKQKILKINQWGSVQWTNMEFAFHNCIRLQIMASDIPDLSIDTTLRGMFFGCSTFNSNINNWNVSNIKDMSLMFAYANSFNQPLSNWNVSNVITMNSMFNGSDRFNQSINNWNVSNVIDMQYMFGSANNFNQPLNNWNVSNVTNMYGLFSRAISFNQNINNWNVGNVTDMGIMFFRAYAFNQPLNNWNVSNVLTMNSMFYEATSFNQSIDAWILSDVSDISLMFYYATSFNQPLNNWDVSNVNNMNGVFENATSFNQPLNNWDVSNVIDMYSLFASATSFNQPLNDWDVSNVNYMSSMFSNARSFDQTLNSWDVSNVVYMDFMFHFALSFDQDLGNWNISNVEHLTFIFNGITLSVENYESTLQGWASQNLKPNLNFHGGYSRYCDGTFKDQIINDFNWTITDGGQLLNCITSYLDSDNDNYGDSNFIKIAITIPNGYTIIAGDCNDNDNTVYPNALEICDFKDNNCDGQIDENCPDAFITTWRTTTPNESITLPTHINSIYNYNVDWGDGIITTGHTGVASHTYANAGDYVVKISGTFSRIYFRNNQSSNNIISIDQWGNNQWTSMGNAFYSCENLNGQANDSPDLSLVTNMEYMFSYATSFNQEIGNWDVSNVTNMDHMFYEATNFNKPIGSWNVGNVQNMEWMFSYAANFNQPIGLWDVGNVQNMTAMFYRAYSFNQPIGNWNVSNVQNMQTMFGVASNFNQPLESWDVSNVTNMSLIFLGLESFNQPLDLWDVSNVQNMHGMFYGASIFNQPLSSWDVSNVTDMGEMFYIATSFNQSLETWDVGNVTTMNNMFLVATLSLENYEATLQGWASQNLQPNINFHGGSSKYCDPMYRDIIIHDFNWTITDGGVSTQCITSFRDSDNDTYGDPYSLYVSISLPVGHVLNDDDCNDNINTVYLGAPEICDCYDNNCNGNINEGLTCAPPIAKCFTTPKVVTIGPSKLIYNGPGLKDVYRVDLNLLDNASVSLCNPIKEIARTTFPVASSSSLSSTFDWTTLGACDDILLNGNINNEDKGFSWEDCLPVTIGGDNNKIRTYKLKVADIFGTSTCSGSYKVVYSSSASPEIIDVDEYGLTEVDLNENLLVYPNPSLSELNILIDVNIDKLSTYSLLIYDVLGKEVTKLNELNSGVIKVNTESLNAGTYNVVVKSGDDVFTKRWVKI